jgi:tetratricopeptide (TPR) repeat protein
MKQTMTTKKKIICPKCTAKLKFDPDKITSEVIKFNCPGCTSILRIRKADLQKESPSPPQINHAEQGAGITIEDPGEKPLDLVSSSEITEEGAPEKDQNGVTEEVGRQADSEIFEKVENEFPDARKPLPGELDGPLIPEDRIVSPKSSGEMLLEDFFHEKSREYEEGEPEEGDTEWTQFAHKKVLQPAESKIDMNELPASAPDLKETLASLCKAETHNLQGETHLNKKSYNQAISEFSQAIEINTDYVDAIINRGRAFSQLGRFNDALMDFNHALKLEKNDAELYNKRGEVYLQNTMYDQAIKDFTTALILNPMCSNAYLNRGQAYSEKEMHEEAMADFDQAVKTDFDNASFSLPDQVFSEVNCDEKSTGKKEEAAKLNDNGLTDLENEKYEEAIKKFSRAIDLTSCNAESYINRGRTYFKLDQPNKAMDDFNHAILSDSLNSSVYYWRALVWKAKDDHFNMTKDLKLSCELGYEAACREYRKFKPPQK